MIMAKKLAFDKSDKLIILIVLKKWFSKSALSTER